MAVGTQHLHVVHLVVTAGGQGNDVIDLGCKWQQFFAALALPFLVVSPRTPKSVFKKQKKKKTQNNHLLACQFPTHLVRHRLSPLASAGVVRPQGPGVDVHPQALCCPYFVHVDRQVLISHLEQHHAKDVCRWDGHRLDLWLYHFGYPKVGTVVYF